MRNQNFISRVATEKTVEVLNIAAIVLFLLVFPLCILAATIESHDYIFIYISIASWFSGLTLLVIESFLHGQVRLSQAQEENKKTLDI